MIDSNRLRPHEVSYVADVNLALRALAHINKKFFDVDMDLQRRESRESKPIILSFEIHPDSYANTWQSSLQNYDLYYTGDGVNIKTMSHTKDRVAKVATFQRSTRENCKFFWKGEKYQSNLQAHFCVGMESEQFVNLLRVHSYRNEFVRDNVF